MLSEGKSKWDTHREASVTPLLNIGKPLVSFALGGATAAAPTGAPTAAMFVARFVCDPLGLERQRFCESSAPLTFCPPAGLPR
jgi:hypothetical protein